MYVLASMPRVLTRTQVIHWRHHLAFPRDLNPLVRNLIERLCCDAQYRIGTAGGAEEIKAWQCSSPVSR